ncbi:MAG: hypothetical protein JNL40_11135 [Cyclobacteriaceae bacterium]|nr:hypothetical protein [Cyclobacteriaceae bacterium]
MIKDIPLPVVQQVTIAVVREKDNLKQDAWKVYLINSNDVPIENTLVASTGYGQNNGEEQKTSTLRHFLQTVDAHSAALVEPIDPDVFHLNNEYWVSYYIGRDLFDKRFVFLPDSICEENLIFIRELDREGVLHS